MTDPSLRKASSFLVRFLCVVIVFFLGWTFLSELYLSSLVVTYNALAGPEVRFAVHHGSLAVVYFDLQPDPVILQLQGNDVFFMNLLVAPGLLLATPGSLRTRLLWLAGVTGLVWLGHLVSLGFGQYLAIWDFVNSLAPAQAGVLAPRVEELLPRETEQAARAIFDRWRVWGRPTLALLVWFYVAAGYLGLVNNTDGAATGGKP